MHVLYALHGITDWNVAGRVQGRIDTLPNAAGYKQALAIAEQIQTEGWSNTIDMIISSSARRADMTAFVIQGQLADPRTDTDWVTDSRLLECDFGLYEGSNWSKLERTHRVDKEAITKGHTGDFSLKHVGGEDRFDLISRGISLLGDLWRIDRYGTFLLIGHGAHLRHLFHYIVGHEGIQRGQLGHHDFTKDPLFLIERNPELYYRLPTCMNDVRGCKELSVPCLHTAYV